MLKSCPKCGKVHDFNYNCYKNRQVRGKTIADNVRKTHKWHKKSLEIRERDKNLCRCCIADIYETTQIYNYNKLEVHHITSLETDSSKAFDNDNLITLCCYHHKMADKGLIPKYILEKLIDENADYKEIRDMVVADTIPPVSEL